MACGPLPRTRRNTCSGMAAKTRSINGDACFLAQRVNSGWGLKCLVVPWCTDSVSDVRKVLNLVALPTATDFHPQNQLSQSILSLEAPSLWATLCNQLCDLDPLLLASEISSGKWTSLPPFVFCLLQRRNETMSADELVLVYSSQQTRGTGRFLPLQLLLCIS